MESEEYRDEEKMEILLTGGKEVEIDSKCGATTNFYDEVQEIVGGGKRNILSPKGGEAGEITMGEKRRILWRGSIGQVAGGEKRKEIVGKEYTRKALVEEKWQYKKNTNNK